MTNRHALRETEIEEITDKLTQGTPFIRGMIKWWVRHDNDIPRSCRITVHAETIGFLFYASSELQCTESISPSFDEYCIRETVTELVSEICNALHEEGLA